jgi:2-C-methyl-D-erythritol 4-phosphate cytidylyltransferase
MSDDRRGPVWTIVVAAGSGSRFGAPKQFLDLRGVRVVDRSIATAARHSAGVVVVTPAEPIAGVAPIVAPDDSGHDDLQFRVVAGEKTRAGSVRRGLAAVPLDAGIVLVHDGARPLATDEIYSRVIEAVRAGADAVTPAVPVADSLRRRGGGTVDRREIVAVQTPQGFPADVLRAAHQKGEEASDDVTVVENDGGKVVVVDGDRRNLKLTTPLDLDLAEVFLDRGDAT